MTGNQIMNLPDQSKEIFLTDGGIETSLIYQYGFDLPYFAAFKLLDDEKGFKGLRDYFEKYLKIAAIYKKGFILESPTWRASRDWINKFEYPDSSIREINGKAIRLMSELKSEFNDKVKNIVMSGCIGPRGDGYKADNQMKVSNAENYHREQVEAFKEAGVDMVTAITMNYIEEAIGIVKAANSADIPAVISFTVETNGKLPAGQSLKEAIEKVDSATETPPLYFMINCAHPTHFENELRNGKDDAWIKRIKGIRANASSKSHAELDESTELDSGNPEELGNDYTKIKNLFSHMNVFGGCCGTDERHITEIAKQLNNS
jgi:S-methylmethionine-dependent homocysteine/selenocysteine methylase